MAKGKTQTYRGPGVRGDGGSGRPPSCSAASSPASKAALTSITGVCSCAASAASWSSLQSQRHSERADECGDDWEEEGRVRRQAAAPELGALQQHLDELLESHGELLLALNSLRAADHFSARLLAWRLGQRQQAAQALIGRCASIKAAGLAANPLMLLDLAGSAAVDSTLIVQLAQLYGVRLRGPSARRLLQRVGRQSLVIGGVQWGLQGALSLIKQVLLMAAPFSGGLSLAPAAPVALAQAALAVHGTRITGRETARQLLLSAHRGPARPASLLRRLQRADPQAQRWLAHHQSWSPEVGLP